MIHRIDELNEPPVVGGKYLVPHIFGRIASRSGLSLPCVWSVLLPSHEDSKYDPNAKAKHHYHIDPRFTEEYLYGFYDILNINLHSVVFDVIGEVNWIEAVCLREMPTQMKLYTVFGKHFINEFKDKSAKCYRCPHKGTDLTNIPVKDGVITCPAHGLRFNSDTLEVIDI